MTTVNINEAKTHFSSLVSSVENNGEHVVICRYGKAIAEIVPVAQGKRTEVSSELGRFELLFDPTESTEDEWDNA